MLVDISVNIVRVLALVVVTLAACGLYAPGRLIALVRGAVERSWGLFLAVVVRLILGAALIVAAPVSAFPVVFRVLGWVTLAAAVGLMILGRGRLRALIGWLERQPSPAVRSWLVLGIAAGAFLLYGIR